MQVCYVMMLSKDVTSKPHYSTFPGNWPGPIFGRWISHVREERSEAWFHCPLATLPFQQNKCHFMCFHKSYQTSTFLFIIPSHLPIAFSATGQVWCQGSCKGMDLQVCTVLACIKTTKQLQVSNGHRYMKSSHSMHSEFTAYPQQTD